MPFAGRLHPSRGKPIHVMRLRSDLSFADGVLMATSCALISTILARINAFKTFSETQMAIGPSFFLNACAAEKVFRCNRSKTKTKMYQQEWCCMLADGNPLVSLSEFQAALRSRHGAFASQAQHDPASAASVDFAG